MNVDDLSGRYRMALHEAALLLAEEHTAYRLARDLIKARERIEVLEREAAHRWDHAIRPERHPDRR